VSETSFKRGDDIGEFISRRAVAVGKPGPIGRYASGASAKYERAGAAFRNSVAGNWVAVAKCECQQMICKNVKSQLNFTAGIFIALQ